MDTVLQLRDVRYNYNGRKVLAIEELDISRASITGLAGPNGCGKTTLLKLLSGVEKPVAGSIAFVPTHPSTKKNDRRHLRCLLPQESYLLKRTVYENIVYGLRIREKTNDFTTLIHEALELVGLERSFADRQWHELSGGEAQRVALAARLVLKPDCLLLDEPTASVDMESARCIRRAVLLARREWGATLVIASHHRSWLDDICDRIIYLYNGRILECSYENILTGPWKTIDDTMAACELSDGQRVYVAGPSHSKRNAVIAPAALKINSEHPGKDERSFHGIISSLALENHVAGPQAHITCGDQRFLVNISPESLASGNYRPGQQVTLHYNPAHAAWLD